MSEDTSKELDPEVLGFDPKDFMYDERPRRKRTRSQSRGAHGSPNPPKKKRNTRVYCICRRPNNANEPMIGCDYCSEWYHFKCIGVQEELSKTIKKYKCNDCKKKEEIKRQEKLERQRQKELLLQQQLAAIQAAKPVRYKCFLKGCKNFARGESKFCKDACGIEATRMILRNVELLNRIRQNVSRRKEAESFGKQVIKHIQETGKVHILKQHGIEPLSEEEMQTIGSLPVPLANHQITTCVAEMEEIRDMYNVVERCDRNIKELEEKRNSLENFISTVSQISIDDYEAVEDKEKRAADAVDCPACGHPVTVKRFSKHIEQCTSKTKNNESYMVPRMIIDDTHTVMLCNFFDPRSRSYCTRLKATCHTHQEHAKKSRKLANQAGLCGCPLDDALQSMCKYLRKDCIRHSGWEKLKIADIIQQIGGQELQKQWQMQEIQTLEFSLLKKKLSTQESTIHAKSPELQEAIESQEEPSAPEGTDELHTSLGKNSPKLI